MASVSDITTQTTQQKNAEKKAKARQDAAASTGTNPNGQLDKDAFMKLLLTELQYQDPTSPMDTEKMLTQTSQLASVEMQENTNKAMKELVSQLKSNANAYAISALGKMVSTGSNAVTLTDEKKDAKFALYFKTDLANGKIEIKNANGQVVRTTDLNETNAGVHNLAWDGKDASGKPSAKWLIYHFGNLHWQRWQRVQNTNRQLPSRGGEICRWQGYDESSWRIRFYG
ncbi:flagellar hook capping FlgD N-terminal domain-containing protein [Campylobacter concisus]